MEISKIKTLSDNIKNNINKIIIGKNSTIDLILTCILAKGNILLEDTPGTGKTMMAKSLAKSLDINFNRIQFTPDLLPADVIGLSIFNQKDDRFMMQLSLGYPSYDEELQILDRFLNNNPIETINPVCSKKDIVEMQNSISQVYVHSVIKK